MDPDFTHQLLPDSPPDQQPPRLAKAPPSGSFIKPTLMTSAHADIPPPNPLAMKCINDLAATTDLSLRFNTTVDRWHAHMETQRFSSFSGAYIDCAAFDELAGMGSSIVPHIMIAYSADREGWWYMLLNEITGRKGTLSTDKRAEYGRWEGWYVGGAEVERLPA
ncbi:hypothetical protein GLAREA_09095 [Glarea lozoyensis ATCC 20868]|uniref:Uncharacterized protein n=1 Tax=Glarea lozoyensis (strain ATCC 20868 / MF5171) TaxID=1116229 RepID=S3DEV1_GLAL2|nr:uncharacterized protein GLAREA_09095 [Glarea lozoyensis ATCC 20868]EPE36932.1 hypothetical protein GLAREA_09095 [Glarea lozoyensis ATCC 20868]